MTRRGPVRSSLPAMSLALGLLASASASAHAEAGERVAASLARGVWLTPGRDHVALSRELPSADPEASEPEAVRLVFAGFSAPPTVALSTRRASGLPLDTITAPSLVPSSCPPDSAAGSCWETPPLRLTADSLDRAFAPAHERSLEAELGGELRVEAAGRLLAAFRVGAPHDPAFAGLDRLGAKLRVRVLRIAPGGMPAIGGDVASAVALAKKELLASSKLWAQCGVDLQGAGGLDVRVVDPPAVSLIAVGCDAGLPASGGQVNLRIQGRVLRVTTHAGETPRVVAQHLQRALRQLGVNARISPNQRMASGASGAIDLLLSDARGAVRVEAAPALPLSQDATLGVCLGEVDLSNGLSHFVENDAAAGTLEERALVKAFDDGDPSTIEVLIVPSFDQSGRIGESFIDEDGAGIQNTVIIDRAALRAGPRSYALAHELGHILLDMPGHPDDYGVDSASSLMDSDASDASALGPRRLSLEDCRRMVAESGPSSKISLLQAFPLPAATSAAPTTSAR